MNCRFSSRQNSLEEIQELAGYKQLTKNGKKCAMGYSNTGRQDAGKKENLQKKGQIVNFVGFLEITINKL